MHQGKVLAAAVCASLGLVATRATALPAAGAARPNVRLVDAWDHTVDVATLGPKPMLVLYEGKDSSAQNKGFKEELRELGNSKRYQGAISVVLVADVQGYNYWPARGFAKDAVKAKSSEFHQPIYCDWTGAVRNAFDLQRGTSNVVLYGRDGRVLFAHAGNMSPAASREALDLLRQQAEVAATP